METSDKLYSVEEVISPEIYRELDRIAADNGGTIARSQPFNHKTRGYARYTDGLVHDHAWKALGIAAMIGLAFGLLLGDRD